MNKSLKKMRNAIIMMHCAYEQYKEAAEQLEAEQQAAQVDAVKPVVKKAEPLPEPPKEVILPEEVKPYVMISYEEESMVANTLCLLADLGEVQGGAYVQVGLKQFYNKKSPKPFLDRHHVDIVICNADCEPIASRYIHINNLGKEIDLFLRKLGGLSWNRETYEPTVVNLYL